MAEGASRSNSFSQRSHERIVSTPGSLQGADISIDTLDDCEVFVLDYTAAVYVDECSNCRLRIGPVSSFCYFRNCTNCTLSIACQQFRAKDCCDLTVFLFSASDPHIELCSNIRLGPYNFSYPLQDSHFAKAGLHTGVNKWSQVYDHTPSGKGEERHWTIIEPEEYEPIVYEIKELGKPVDPVTKPSMFAENGVKGVVVVAPHVRSKVRERQEKKEIVPPADIIIEDPSGEVSNHDVSNPLPEVEAYPDNIWDAPNNPSEINDEVEAFDDDWIDQAKPSSVHFSMSPKSVKTPHTEFSPFENPLLTSPSPRYNLSDMREVRVCYTRWKEFKQAVHIPGLRVPPTYLQQTLQKVSDTALPYHEQIRMYVISAFCILFTGLLLLLMVVLLYDFVGMYEEGLEFQLILLGLAALGLFVYVVVRLVSTVHRGNRDFQSLLTQEMDKKYRNSGLELTGDLYALRILIRPSDTLAT